MHTKLTIRSICVIVLVGWAGTAGALSLGPVSGLTVIGRPLELSAPIQLDDPTFGSGDGCVSAELLYGDRQLDTGKVQVSLVQGAVGQSYARISTTTLVDEPFVTLVLRAGCNRQSTRRYVLLADAPKLDAIVLSSTASLLPTFAPAPSAVAATDPQAATASARSGKTRSATPLLRPLGRAGSAALRPTAPRLGGRLQLALWDPASEQMPWLRASTELKSLPTADARHRAAATALWRALNARPQDLLRTAERLRGLEGEVSALRSLAAGHRFEISSARESLESAQSQRHLNLALAAVLAMLAGGSAAFFWHRSRRADALVPPWTWYGSLDGHSEEERVNKAEQQVPGAPRSPAVVTRAPVVQPQVVAAPVMRIRDLDFDAPLEFTLPDAVARSAPEAQPEKIVGLSVDALQGAQQQSEFFVSLGQFDEAIAVLIAYLEESSQTPLLAFLELFRIYHALEMQVQYEELQARFRQTFGIDMAGFRDFEDEHRELELYPVAVGRIAASWPSKASQEVIEDLLFKKPVGRRDLLSLHAYRELLWLYSLGQEIVYSTGMPAGLQLLRDRQLSNDHFILPWAGGGQEGPPELSLDRLTAIEIAPELNAFAVDIDLTAARGDAFAHSQPPEPAGPAETQTAPRLHSTSDTEAFDAVMESESRSHRR